MASTRREFWIVSGKALAKDYVRHCITCRRSNAVPIEQQIAPLPSARVAAYRPHFTKSGFDFFDPLHVKFSWGSAKRWSCLFTRLSTRAVHLEVAQDKRFEFHLCVIPNWQQIFLPYTLALLSTLRMFIVSSSGLSSFLYQLYIHFAHGKFSLTLS